MYIGLFIILNRFKKCQRYLVLMHKEKVQPQCLAKKLKINNEFPCVDKSYMIKNNHQRVPNLHRVHLIIKLVRGVHHGKSKVVKNSLQNINHEKYLYCLKSIFDLVRLNREYLTGKEGDSWLSYLQKLKDSTPRTMALSCHTKNYWDNFCKGILDHHAACTICIRVQTKPTTPSLLPKNAPNGPKIMIKVKGWKYLGKDNKITLQRHHVVGQPGYSIYKDIKALFFSIIIKHAYSTKKAKVFFKLQPPFSRACKFLIL